MAIERMKRLRVIAMASQREELLQGLLHLGCVEISEPDGRLSDPEWSALLGRGGSSLAETRSEIAEVDAALAAIKQYAPAKEGLFIQRKAVSEETFLSGETAEAARAAAGKIRGLLQDLGRLQTEASRLRARRAALVPWEGLDLPLSFRGTAHTVVRLETFPAGTDLEAVRAELGDTLAEVREVGSDRQQIYALTVCHTADEERMREVLRPYGPSVTSFQGLEGTAKEEIASLDAQIEENAKAQEADTAALAGTGGDRDLLRLYADRLQAEALRQKGAGDMLTDGTIVFFEGWAPADRVAEVGTFLDGHGCAWEESDPAEGEDPPVRLKSNWFTRPLNMVTEMYSLPAYDCVDPNPLMAPFFVLFYGIMMADMGYGLLMFLAGRIIRTKYRPKGGAGHLFGLMELCGVSTFIMGALTGGFFGDFLTQAVKLTTGGDFALPALFTPLDDTLMILVGAMCLGFVQIVTGMIVSFCIKLRRGQIMDAVWEEVTWWIVFAGIAVMVLAGTPVLLYVGLAMVVAGPVINGQGAGKITGVFSSLYNHVTGYFGDILSYSRLMALMLAGSVIAQVFNTLGAIPGNIVIFIIISMAGNALNFALNLLGCYVHDLRLQCLEYFGKFYEDGGRPFRPLAIDGRYVDIETT